MSVPNKETLRLGRAQRMYVERLLAGGLHGDSAAQVVYTLFCRGLQECVPLEWIGEATIAAAVRDARSEKENLNEADA
jgi:hypothetical protein